MRGNQRTPWPRRDHGSLALALAAAAIVLAGCGGDEVTSPATSSAGATSTSSKAGKGPEQFVLKTSVKFPKGGDATGEVVSGSRLGNSEFCIGAKFRDRQSGGTWFINRTLHCPGGQITLGFTPNTGAGNGTQSGKWGVIGTTGRYTGLKGSGELNVVYPAQRGADTKGHETFTGTVTQ
jgi:hypothetical protein